MQEIEFRPRNDHEDILIDGVPLLDLVRAAELPYAREEQLELLGCTCGIAECWALLARIEVTEAEVRWSGFRNNSRDWDLSPALGPFVFARRQYEESLRATAPLPRLHVTVQ